MHVHLILFICIKARCYMLRLRVCICWIQNTIETHYRGIIGRCWKRWAKVSKYCSNKDLVNHLYNDDFLDIQNTNTRNRQPFAMFYSNGLHHLMCDTENCYRPQQPSMCVYKFCYKPIFRKFHLLTCNASRHGIEHEQILFISEKKR